ncbi:glycosyltransferase [Tellurirhabdus bombi]|uniref:glycosyltransferase n=1 Tax=Tellurirhabdus bombi TaxID=2907205 RepID=UPI001F3D080C|nr:glycosyltransferase [Tellurirhabdus bombi]
MTISGFSYIRNGFEYQYPFLQSIQSILPICDEFVIAVGNSKDGTREAIEALNSPKIRIVDTVWDEQLRVGGKIFAQQSNVALRECKGDWLFHIQADEVIHEADLPVILKTIQEIDKNPKIEGLLLAFLNFYGSYDYLNNTRYQHKKEVRAFRKGLNVFSYRDSQGFRKYPSWEAYQQGHKGQKLAVHYLDKPVYHYSYVRPPEQMNEKSKFFETFWHDDTYIEKVYTNKKVYDYYNIERVKRFEGTHPAVMQEAVRNGSYDFDPTRISKKLRLKDKIAYWIEDRLPIRIGEYKNYRLIEP